MDSFEIHWRSSASKELRKLDRQVISRVLETTEQLTDNPYPLGVRKLRGADRTYRMRIGDFRVVYEVDAESRIITIARVRHRRNAYR